MKLPRNIVAPLLLVPLLAALSLALFGTVLLNLPAAPTDAAPPKSVPLEPKQQYWPGTPTPRPNPAPELHGADIWHDFSVTGFKGGGSLRKVKVAVIDSGFDHLTFSLLHKGFDTSNLNIYCWDKDNTIFNDTLITHCNGSDHGTKVVEALLDIAPDIELYIVEVPSDERLNDAVDWLRDQHLDIVVMSLGFGLNAEGDGDPAFISDAMSSINAVVANRETVWVNAAGNDALNNWSGTWETMNVGTSTRIKMGPGTSLNGISVQEGSTVTARLRWDDTFPGSSSGAGADCNLDLVSMRPHHHVADPLGGSKSQDGGSFQNPYESMTFTAPQDGDSNTTERFKYSFYIKVVDCPGTKPQWIQLQVTESTGVATLDYPSRASTNLNDAHPDYRQIGVPAELDNAKFLAVGASNTAGSDIKSFSSRGPRSDEMSVKLPHLAASACIYTWADSDQSCGTSFAAPHVAGLAALVKSKYPNKTAASIVQYLKNRALDRTDTVTFSGEADPNNRWGEGLALLPGAQLLDGGNPVLSDGNSRIKLTRLRPPKDYGINTSLPGSDRITVSIDGNGLTLSNDCSPTLRSKIVQDGDTISLKACQYGVEKVRLSDRLRSEVLFTYTFDTPDNRPSISSGISNVSMEVGNSRVYNLVNNFKEADSYSSVSSDPTIATVVHASPTMTVTAVGVGTATITSTATNEHGSRSISFTVTVEPSAPEAPTGITGSNQADDSIYVNWDSVDGASKYRVQYREVGTASWQTATSNDPNPGYRVSGLECGTSYEFRVAAFGDGSTASAEWGENADASDPVSTLPCLPLAPAPQDVTVTTPVPRDTARLTWSYQANTEKYRVRYREEGTIRWITSSANIGPGATVGTSNGYTVTGLSCGNDYNFEVTGHGDDTVTRDTWGTPTEVDGSTEPCNRPMFTTDGLSLVNISDITPVNTVLATLTVTDATVDETLSYTLSGSGSNYFAITAQTGSIRTANISVARTLQIGTYSLTATVTDKHGQTDTAAVAVEVVENLAPPVIDLQRDSRTRNTLTLSWTPLSEGATLYRVRHKLTTVSSWTEDATDLTAGPYTVESLTCETDYDFDVAAYGDGTAYKAKWGHTTELQDSAGDCEEPQFPEPPPSFEVRETENVGYVVGTVAATDVTPNETLTYEITGGNTGNAFAIGETTGEITVAQTLDYATLSSYSLALRVTDTQEQTDTTTVTITVLENLPIAPSGLRSTDTTRTSISLAWDSLEGTDKYRVQIQSTDSDNWADMTINQSGTTYIADNRLCGAGYRFRVSAYGDGTTYVAKWGLFSETLTVSTTDCEEPVFSQDGYQFTVDDDVEIGAEVGKVPATDPTPGDTLTYAIVNGNQDGNFAINSSTGLITVAEALDATVEGSYTLDVTVTDQDGQLDFAFARIKVQQIYTVTFGDSSYTVDEDVGAVTISLELDRATRRSVTIPLITAYGGTLSSADYSGVPESVTFLVGQQVLTINISIVDDEDDDDGETLYVAIIDEPDYVLYGDHTATAIHITDNDVVRPTETTTVWSATLTVGESDSILGYDATDGFGSLSDTTFTWLGTDYTITGLTHNPSTPKVYMNTSGLMETDDRSGLTLHLGNVALDFEDTTRVLNWVDATADWTNGDTVAVSIVYDPPAGE